MIGSVDFRPDVSKRRCPTIEIVAVVFGFYEILLSRRRRLKRNPS